jgi:GntR family transcriptional regulator / MocR family aminotransferase
VDPLVLLPLDGDGALYQQVYRALRSEILSRRLPPGGRLPSTRALAADLGISRNIAILAYDQLLGEGYAEARRGSGTIVAPSLPGDWRPVATLSSTPTSRAKPTAEPRLARAGSRALAIVERRPVRWDLQPARLPYDFRFGRPAFADFPHALWCRLLGRRARRATLRDLDYGPPEGREELREALAERLSRFRGIDVGAERIVIVNGSQQALDLVARVLLDPGDRVLIEEPHYLGARWVFVAAGAELVPGRVDEDGLQVPGVRARRPAPRLAYVTPSHQFPTGVVLPAGRRLELLNWAARTGAFILEDDYDSEYRYEGRPLQALAALDAEQRVIYVGTFSKLMFPALRLGYLVLPESLVRPVAAAKAIADTGSAMLEQLTLADFIRHGHFERHLQRSRRRNASRRAVLLEAIRDHFGERAEVSGANAGLHVLVWLRGRGGGPIGSVGRKAQAAGVGLYSVAPCYLEPPRRTGVLLGYGALRERDIREGIRHLASALR